MHVRPGVPLLLVARGVTAVSVKRGHEMLEQLVGRVLAGEHIRVLCHCGPLRCHLDALIQGVKGRLAASQPRAVAAVHVSPPLPLVGRAREDATRTAREVAMSTVAFSDEQQPQPESELRPLGWPSDLAAAAVSAASAATAVNARVATVATANAAAPSDTWSMALGTPLPLPKPRSNSQSARAPSTRPLAAEPSRTDTSPSTKSDDLPASFSPWLQTRAPRGPLPLRPPRHVRRIRNAWHVWRVVEDAAATGNGDAARLYAWVPLSPSLNAELSSTLDYASVCPVLRISRALSMA